MKNLKLAVAIVLLMTATACGVKSNLDLDNKSPQGTYYRK